MARSEDATGLVWCGVWFGVEGCGCRGKKVGCDLRQLKAGALGKQSHVCRGRSFRFAALAGTSLHVVTSLHFAYDLR
jgi:hypothetical protein